MPIHTPPGSATTAAAATKENVSRCLWQFTRRVRRGVFLWPETGSEKHENGRSKGATFVTLSCSHFCSIFTFWETFRKKLKTSFAIQSTSRSRGGARDERVMSVGCWRRCTRCSGMGTRGRRWRLAICSRFERRRDLMEQIARSFFIDLFKTLVKLV